MQNKHRKVIYPIEWLRAFAVISVVLYHFDKSILPGGYLGVDIFLVISGYLVGGSLSTANNLDLKGLSQFINKRFWRLQPALFFTVLVCFILALFLAPPEELKDLSKNTISTLIGVSNIYFWTNAGYFGGNGEYNWLLHTWSLSLEWQYYILYALLCITYFTFFRKNISLIFLFFIWGISFLLAVLLSSQAPSANFFLLPSRLWEFITGTIVFIIFNKRKLFITNVYKPFIFTLSLIGLLTTVISIDESIALPSWQTLYPVLLTATCLACSTFNVQKYYLYLTRPFFMLGQSSYSIYLIHWPLLVAFGTLAHTSLSITLLLFITIITIGYFMFKLIEIPFNGHKKKFLLVFTVTLSITIVVAIFINLSGGLKGRFTTKQLEILQSANYVNGDRKYCLNVIDRKDKQPLNKNCQNSATKTNEMNFLFWGDSHLEALRTPLLEKQNTSVDFLGVAGCPPILNLNRLHGSKECHIYSKEALEYIKSHSVQYDFIVIGGRISAYIYGNTSALGRAEGGLNQYIYDIEFPENNRLFSFENRIRETISELTKSNIPIILFGGIPEFGEQIPREVFKSTIFNILGGNNYLESIPLRIVLERQKSIDTILQDIASEYQHVTFYDPKRILCKKKTCFSLNNGIPIYFDNDHLNKFGANIVINDFFSFMSIN